MSEVGQKLIAAIREAAERNPDKIVPKGGCEYYSRIHSTTTGNTVYQPSCIVGHAFDIAKIIDDPQDFYEHGPNTDKFEEVVSAGFDWADGLDDGEGFWIRAVQDYQDDQVPWAQAVAQADIDLEKERPYLIPMPIPVPGERVRADD